MLLRGVDDPLAGHHRVDRLAHRVRAGRGAVRVPLDRPACAEDDVRAEIEDAVKFAEESPAADEYLPYVVKE